MLGEPDPKDPTFRAYQEGWKAATLRICEKLRCELIGIIDELPKPGKIGDVSRDAWSWRPFEGVPIPENYAVDGYDIPFEKYVLDDVAFHVWPVDGWDDGGPDCPPENCQVAIYASHGDYTETKMPLIEFLRESFTGESNGPSAEIIALERLKVGIDEIIAKLREQGQAGEPI